MTTKQICENCAYSQWTGASLMCTNKDSDEYLMFVLGIDTCDKWERYSGAGDGDETDTAGALS